MRIGFEAKKIVSNLTGIGNYARGVVNALSLYFPTHEYYLFSVKKGRTEAVGRLHPADNIRFMVPTLPFGSLLKEWWRCHGIINDLKRQQIDIYHGLSNELPWGIKRSGIKSIITIHDLIFLRYPKTYPFLTRWTLKFKVAYACKHADRIIAISQQTKRDIMHFYKIPESKIDVIYQGCDSSFYTAVAPEQIQAVKDKYNLPQQYILSVGTIEERKNHCAIVKALSLLKKNVNLVIVSKQTKYQQKLEKCIHDSQLESQVHILNHVPNADLPTLYQGSSLFVYSSFFEGFGIPVLEALVSDVPVVAATGSCLEEAGGDDSVYCGPFDYQSLASEIEAILQSPEKAEHMIRKGKEHAKQFSMQHIAGDIISTYQKVLKTEKE